MKRKPKEELIERRTYQEGEYILQFEHKLIDGKLNVSMRKRKIKMPLNSCF